METIITLAMNPAIDKSASVAQVIADRKLYCHTPRFEPGGGGVNSFVAAGQLQPALCLEPSQEGTVERPHAEQKAAH